MTFNSFIAQIPKIKNITLKGQSIQLKMAPPMREALLKQTKENKESGKKAGVMALIYPNNNEAFLVLILRKTYKGVHSAQVGFPGGKYEEFDSSLKETALRETEEEIGVNVTDINVVKALTELYIPPSNFYVYPYIGYVTTTPTFKKQDSEVEAIIEVPLDEFLSDLSVVETTVNAKYKADMLVPAFKLQNHIVWGATAMMLNELKAVLLEALKPQ